MFKKILAALSVFLFVATVGIAQATTIGGRPVPDNVPAHSDAIYSVLSYGAKCDGITDDSAAFQDAVNAASVYGGIVTIPAGTCLVNSSVTLTNGVTIRGAGWAVSPADQTVVIGGTELLGSGKNAGFVYTPNTYVAQPTLNQVYAEALQGVTIQDIAFKNFTYPVQIGSTYNTGAWYSTFRHLLSIGATQWGFYCENCSTSTFEDVNVWNNATGAIGAMWLGTSQSNYVNGNNIFIKLFAQSNPDLQRGIVFQAHAGTVSAKVGMNHNTVYSIQNNANGTLQSQAVTMRAHGDLTLIDVVDGTKYPDDMPVAFSATINGFKQYQTYFVIKNGVADGLAANQIQVANQMGGTAITPSAATAVNILTYGFQNIEGVGYGDQGYNNIQSLLLNGIDAEGRGNNQIYLQQGYFDLSINQLSPGGQSGGGAQYSSNLCFRAAKGTYSSRVNITYDADTSVNLFSLGAQISNSGSDPVPIVQRAPIGIYQIASPWSTPALNLSPHYNVSLQSQTTTSGGGNSFIYPVQPLGQTFAFSTLASQGLWTGSAGIRAFTSTAAGTWTLSQITPIGAGGATNSMAGLVQTVCNGSTDASALLVAKNAADYFGWFGNAKASYSIAQGGCMSFAAGNDGTHGIWFVLSNNGGT